ncbi:MAG: RNA polymerase sigma factor, partial [Planctomycetota bacterium]
RAAPPAVSSQPNARPTPCQDAAAARAGDRVALARLLRTLQDPVWRYCLSQLRNHADADDATQETARRVVASIGRFRGGSTAKTWVLGVALNVCRERRRDRTKHGDTTPAHEQPSTPEDRRRPDQMAIAAEEAGAVHKLLAGLPPRQGEAVVLRYFEQLSVQETADAMGCSVGAVKATLWQALRRLREQLQQPDPTPTPEPTSQTQ